MKRFTAAIAVSCLVALAACQPKREPVVCTADAEPVVAMLSHSGELRYRGKAGSCVQAEFSVAFTAEDIYERFAVGMAALGWRYVAELPDQREFCHEEPVNPPNSMSLHVHDGILMVFFDRGCRVGSEPLAVVPRQWPVLWGRALTGPARAPAVRLGSVIAVGGADTGPSDLTGYDDEGSRRWFEQVPDAVVGEAANGDQLFLHLANGMLVGLDGATGHPRWVAEEPPFANSAPLAADANHVYAMDSSGFLVAWNAADGTVAWRVPSDSAYAGPIAGGGYVFTSGRAVTAYQASTGRRLWTAPAGLPAAAAIGTDGVSVFGCSSAARLGYALSAKNGKLRWRTRFEECGPAMTTGGGAVFTVGRDLTGVDARTGRALWPPRPIGVAQIPAFGGDRVYLHDHSDLVLGVDVRSGEATWWADGDRVRPADPGVTVAGGVLYAVGETMLEAYDTHPPGSGG